MYAGVLYFSCFVLHFISVCSDMNVLSSCNASFLCTDIITVYIYVSARVKSEFGMCSYSTYVYIHTYVCRYTFSVYNTITELIYVRIYS